MGDKLYRIIRLAGYPFRFQITGMENIRDHNPAIFASNHLGSAGPIAIIISFPWRLYPWAVGEMMDFDRAPAYLYEDFVHPAWKLNGRFGMWVSYLLSRIAIRLLVSLDSIKVDKNLSWSTEYFYRSLDYLRDGKDLLIFPENTRKSIDPLTGFHYFSSGFCWLGEMYRKSTGKKLPIYPVAVKPQSTRIAIGKPIFFELDRNRGEELLAFNDSLYRSVANLFLSIKASPFELAEPPCALLDTDSQELETNQADA